MKASIEVVAELLPVGTPMRSKTGEYQRAYARDYYSKNRTERLAYTKERRNSPEHKERFKQYHKSSHVKKRYGITLEEKQAIFVSQGSCCAICKTTDNRGKSWCLDHCHKTNKIRGVLCHYCNVLLGNAKDTVTILEAAIEYLNHAPTLEIKPPKAKN